MPKFHVQHKGGITITKLNAETGLYERKTHKAGSYVELTKSQCKLFSSKGVILPEDDFIEGESTDVTAELVKALSKKTKDELEGILIEGEIEYDESSNKKVLAQLIVEHDLVEAE